ncbi:UDP-glucuronosyltransferase 2C1-like isoform X2 [Syngnathus typhle]|uniref:UDP-glucuronosyltransferase 2C1-like isoform X2 n=1 Tax=Syngnathus typhle TaxID=161592 RepID=UPI002A69F76F|nr:UDP-glucuronosyltransferase 2C1-like isoform X2 [Syngnathus typhle]XP_061138921.1 UDP-glucuronosyltransferase 2C1-like isoform X2 [Syngnathus typhle]
MSLVGVTMSKSHMIFTLLLIQLPCVFGGKILVFPLDGSHWLNMKGIIEELYAKGHEISVVRPSDSWYITEKSPLYNSVNLLGQDGFKDHFESFVSLQLETRLRGRSLSLLPRIWNAIQNQMLVVSQFSRFHKLHCETIVEMFENKTQMQSFHNAKYDVVLTDLGIGGGALLARHLNVPLVYNVRWTFQGEAHDLIAPSPLSYSPFLAARLTDKMTFRQRIINVLAYILGSVSTWYISEPHYKPIVKRYFGSGVDYSTFFLDADIWLLRNNFIFEFPRPTMPNLVYISGFQCKPPKQLPVDLEEFVQSSGDHGVVMMTLGTLVAKLPLDVTEEIAAAFAQLPQKVVWRYLGQKPANLGNNTLLVDWLPQNDLLAHPKTRVFVTHGGINGVQEAIYHGVPIVGLPLFFDQHDNLNKIQAKGGAINVDFAALDRHIFADALVTVLQNSSYRENMQRLSRLQRDQPMKPMDQAVFWIEYVIRHKGAGHLKAQSNKMSSIVYHSVDVIVVLLTIVLLVIFTCLYILRVMYRTCFVGKKVKHE